MVPSIGPIQGLHPSANNAPMRNELEGRPSVRKGGSASRRSRRKTGARTNPSSMNPKKSTRIPPILPNTNRYSFNKPPNDPASAPAATKMHVNPRIKNSPFLTIVLRTSRRRNGSARSAAGMPLIKARYPGMTGSVQGARNMRTPARKAGMMSVTSSMLR